MLSDKKHQELLRNGNTTCVKEIGTLVGHLITTAISKVDICMSSHRGLVFGGHSVIVYVSKSSMIADVDRWTTINMYNTCMGNPTTSCH